MLKLGLNEHISNKDYHGDRQYISSSGLKLILKDEDLFYEKYVLGNKDLGGHINAFDVGSYIHAVLLEPEVIEDEFAIYEGAVRFGKRFDEFKQLNNDKIIILQKEKELGDKIYKSFLKYPRREYLTGGKPEETFCAIIDDVALKVRTDYIAKDYVLDVKTTSYPLSRKTIQSTIHKYDYDLSAALYLDVAAKCLDKKLDRFLFLFVNKTSKLMRMVEMSPELIENGRKKYRYALSKYKKLKAEGFFDPNKELPLEIDKIGLSEYARFK